MNEYHGVPKNSSKGLENFHLINLSIFVLLKTRSIVLKFNSLGEERHSVFQFAHLDPPRRTR